MTKHRGMSLSSMILGRGTRRILGGKLRFSAVALAGTAVAVGWVMTRRRSTTRRFGLPPLHTVSDLDVERYMGTWYEIARFPHRFERGCTGTTATYALHEDGRITVVNRCYLHGLDGRMKRIQGVARRAKHAEGEARFEVSFFPLIWGDYWVLEVGKEYQYAVVGHPGRDHLWILSRTPTMDRTTYEGILDRLRDQHYPVERLQRTVQPPPQESTVRSTSPSFNGQPPRPPG